jgi:hypothetical protein
LVFPAVLLASFAAAAGAHPASSRVARRAVMTVRAGVTAPGLYGVSIVVGGPRTEKNRVALQIGSIKRDALTGRHRLRVHLSLRLQISGQTLTVTAIGKHVRPTLAVTVRRLGPPPATPAASSAPSAAPIAPTPPPTPTPSPAPPPSSPPSGSPYNTLVWSDDFISDWAKEGGSGSATEPLPHTWSYDNYGGCGNSPPQESSYPGTQATAYLSSQGLVLPVTSTGPNQYAAAQLDTAPISGESWQYGAIEASIALPSGQGLCPAFWMLSNNGPTGEIDILEAPSFVGPQYGPFAPFSIFTLHVNTVQVWEDHVTPSNWSAGAPNVYGLYWTPTSLTWTVNGVAYASIGPSSLASPSQWSAFTSGAFHLLLDEAVGGWPGDPPPGTVYTQPMTVQWVRVYH